MLIPEMVVIDIVLANTTASVWWRVANDVVHLYTLLWAIGLVATERIRPHRIDGERVRLRVGVLQKIDTDRANIAATVVRRAGANRRHLKRECGPETALLTLEGAPALELAFHAPVQVRSLFGRVRAVQRAVVAVDDPHAFASALLVA
jgi:hypothetical protein